MRKALSGIVLAILSIMFITFTTGSSNADVPGLQIGAIGYNARGADTWFNRNKEYVDIKNISSDVMNLNGLVIEDNWAHTDTSDSKCNTYTVGNVVLNPNETLRVYIGNGTPAVSGTYHYVYVGSKPGCGYRGHIINNLGDTIWISKGGVSESKSFSFENGYYFS